MNFQLKFNNPNSTRKISFSDKMIFLGSCFSDEISLLASSYGFNVKANHFGTLFHPIALAQNILDSIHDRQDLDVILNEDVFFDFNCSGKIYGMSEKELREKVISLRMDLQNDMKRSSFLFITFGTAFAYHLNENQQVVGNCHKQPSTYFTKKMTEISEIVSLWKRVISEIRYLNPNIQICFTVSPVRHVKDGLSENNLSKSTLFLAIKEILTLDSIVYFPAYELVNDVLRDYRFFKEDMVHPNELAIQFVWDNFMGSFLEESIQDVAKNVNHLKKAMQHRLSYPKSKQALKFNEHIEESLRVLQRENKDIFLG